MMLSLLRSTAVIACIVGVQACGGGGGSQTQTAPPVITSEPKSLTVNSGASAAFSVTATGATSYQWQRNGNAITGATADSYSITTTSANNGDSYTVVATNAGGSTTSLPATLRVTGLSVLAGQIGGEGYADGDKSQARFWGPAAVALDTSGNLYVADYNAVRKISPAGVVSTLVGTPRTCGEQPGQGGKALLCYPYAIAVDGADNVYVSDYLGTTIWRIDANGAMTQFSAAFSCIESLSLQGTLLYVGDSCGGLGYVKTIDTTAPAGPAQVASMNGPIAGLGLDQAQNIYVANDTTIGLYSAGVVSTLAGMAGTAGSTDGQGSAARFGCILYDYGFNYIGTTGAAAIATLPSGTSYVSDYCNGTIRMISATGAVTTLAGKAGVIGTTDGKGAGALFSNPAGLVADSSGNLFVADYNIGTIRKITPDGTVTTYAGQTAHVGHLDGPVANATFCSPYGVAADAQGNLYVSDTYNYVIRKITPAGVVSTVAGTAGVRGSANGTGAAAQFALPQGIAIDASGNLYVADYLNRAVREITPAGVVTTFAVGFQAQPIGVAVDASGNVYMTDRTGIYEAVPLQSFGKIAALPQASAITVAADGTVYVTAGDFNTNTGTVYSLSPTHQLTAIATTGLSYRLQGIVMGGDGNLYVSDLQNSVISKVTTSGVVSAVVGSPDLPIGTAPGGLPAKVNSPRGLALLSTGSSVSLAVVDSFENAILRVDLP
jgi:streptogramin lyase